MQPSAAWRALMSAPAIDTVTIGLEKQLEEIRGLLCKGQLERRVIPITGMGGIGKTTLAKEVYHDEAVMWAFPLRAWITVSQNYKPENIFADLLFALENENRKALVQDGDTTEDKLLKILTAKKYLIVLDDLWSEKAWDDIKKVFGNPRKRDGSRIVITTRNEEVAFHADSSSPLQKMDLMDEANSWALLKHKVFPHGKEFLSYLEDIGKGVSMNCGGLPLAIVLVANILSTIGESRDSWEQVAEDVYSAISEDGVFDRIMSLSYTDLPLHLRPCFLYMSSFPQDYEIPVSKLIKLWISEGFVESEDEAEGYLNNLIHRNLVFPTAFRSNNKVKSCDVHDFVRDLLRRVAVDENYEHRLSIARENNKQRLNIARENSDLVSFLARLPNPEGAAYALQNVLTLSVLKKLICTEKMMKVMSNVKKLGITYLGDRYKEDYQLQNLVLLQNLEKLTLIVKKGSPQQKHKPVFPKTLRKLTLSGWRFPWADMKAVASLPNLQVLKLRDHACEGDTWDINEESDEESDEEAVLVQFSELEHLLIDESDLETWVVIKENFPRLKRLVFNGCGNLNEIPDDVGNIASLELIEVDRANMSLVECVDKIHKELEGDGNTNLKIRVL